MKKNKYQSLNEQLAEENQDLADKYLQEIYKEKRKQREKILAFVSGIYMSYKVNENGKLILTQADKRKIKAQISNKLTTIGVALGTNEDKIITNILQETVKNTYFKTHFIMDLGVSLDIPMGGLTKDAIKKIINKQLVGKSYSTRIWDNQTKLIAKLQKEILSVINDGKDVRKASKVIKDRFGVSTYEAKRLTVNETKNVQTRIQEKIYKESDVVNKVTWISTLDSLTRDEHQILDGQVWDVNEKHPSPEEYVSCRCTLAPVIEGWSPSKRYVKETGKTIEYINYQEWLKSKGV